MDTYQVPATPDTYARVPHSVAAALPDVLLGLYTRMQARAKGRPVLDDLDQPALAKLAGCSVRTLGPRLRALEAAGLLRIERPGQGHPNRYHFTAIPLRGAKDKAPNTQHATRNTQHEMPEQERTDCQSRSANSAAPSYLYKEELEESPPPTPASVPGGGGDSERVLRDAGRIQRRLRLDGATCLALARTAEARGTPRRYVRELLDYVTSAPGVQSPAGCFRALLARGETRPPPTRRSSRPVEGLDPAKYAPGGKYGHIFNRAPAQAT